MSDNKKFNPFQNEFGMTIAMSSITVHRKDPPERMRHDPTIKDNYGNTIAMYWIEYVRTDPPEWMRYDPTIKNME